MHCFAFRYRTGSNMIMKRNETLNSIHPVRLSTFVSFGTAFDQTRAKTGDFGGQQKRLISSKRIAISRVKFGAPSSRLLGGQAFIKGRPKLDFWHKSLCSRQRKLGIFGGTSM